MRNRAKAAWRLAFVAGFVATAGAAAAQSVLIETRAGGSPMYSEPQGTWLDLTASSTAPGVPAAVPGSRMLSNPAPAEVAAMEFAPVLGAATSVSVELTWPSEASARGLILSLVGATPPQEFQVTLDPAKANTWQKIGDFQLAGVTAPKFRLSTGGRLAPAQDGQALTVAVDAARFTPGAVVDDPFAGTAVTAANPFAGTAPAANPFEAPSAAANPFDSAGTAPAPVVVAAPMAVTDEDPFARPAAVANPFEAPVAAPASPFEADVAAPAVATAPADPFAGDVAVDSVAIPLPAPTPAAPSQQPILEPFDTVPLPAVPATSVATGTPAPLGLGDGPASSATADPFAGSATSGSTGTAAMPNAPSSFVLDPTKALAVIESPRTQGTEGEGEVRVITSNLPQPGPSRAPSRSLANTLITSDSTVFASSGNRLFYNPLFDEVQDTEAGRGETQRVVEIEWAGTLEQGKSKSSSSKRPLVVIFYADNPESEAFSLNVLAQPKVAEALNRAVPVRLRMSDNRDQAATMRVFQTPYAVVLDKFGFTEGHISERKDAGAFLEQLNRLLD